MRNLNLSFVVILLVFSITSCYEPIKGCLDTFSSNYDVTADESCDDCCKYPNLVLRFDNKWDDVALLSDDIVVDDFGNEFAIRQFEFFISDIVLRTMTGTTFIIEDSILLNIDGNDLYFKKDFTHIDLKKISYTIGEIKADKDIIGFQFSLGLDSILNQLNFDDLSTGFVLKEFEDSLYIDDHFVMAEIEVKKDTSIDLYTNIPIIDNRFHEEFYFNTSLTVDKGEDIIFTIIIDFKKWFSGIDIRVDDILRIEEILIDNSKNAFSIE